MARFSGISAPRALGLAFALALTALAGACASTASGQVPAPIARPESDDEANAKFAQFIADFRAAARDAGITRATYDRAMSGLQRNARVETLNQEQPEFVKPVWDYLDGAVSQWRVGKGQEMLAAYGPMLAGLERKTGVPKEILTAIWGMESAYGQSAGSFNLFEALATLAYDGPRQAYARRELIAALKMVQDDGFKPSEMTSSWAGAFGATQFVPSAYLSDAVDGDGDGKIDLWHSPADALASAAHLLTNAGWQKDEPCETEVRLPDGFPYEQAEMDNIQPVAAWRKLGVKTVFGAPLADAGGNAAIYLPAGARGPAFLIFDNFRTVLKYNNAASYALAVCYLAHRLDNGAEIAAGWPRDEIPLTRDQRFQFQSDLKKLGYDPGDVDGMIGKHVREALRGYQKAHGLVPDGFATAGLLARMDSEVQAKGL